MVRWLRRHGLWFTLGALAFLLALLAVLQYRWTAEISRAEAERRRAQLERSAAAFAGALSRELAQIVVGFRQEPGVPLEERRRFLIAHLAALRRAEHPGLVSDVWLATRTPGGAIELERCARGAGSFTPAPWTPRLAFLRDRIAEISAGDAQAQPLNRRGRESFPLRPITLHDPPPMLIVPLLEVSHQGPMGRPGSRWMRLRVNGLAAIELDQAYLHERLLPQLAEAHFGPLAGSELVVAVLRRTDNYVVYASSSDLPAAELKRADVQASLLAFARPAVWTDRRGREASSSGAISARSSAGGAPGPGLEIVEVHDGQQPPGVMGPPLQPAEAGTLRLDSGPDGEPGTSFPPWRPFELESGPGGTRTRRVADEDAPWLLAVRHRGGSLEQAVGRLARRNFAIGLGVLALLGAAAVVLATGAQRARRLARQQLEFVAGVTHELNTPLAGIRSAGQNLAAGIVTDAAQVRRYGDLIDQEGRRLAGIVAQVLDFSGIESGRRVYAADALTLAPLVEEVVADLGLALEQSGVSLERDLPPELAVRGDASALRRVVANLLTNAIKFASSGKLVRLRASRRRDGQAVVLRVEDHGPGIPPTERERVFEPFHRGSAAQRNEAPGSGLGLSLVRRIVQAHRGRVWIEEAEGGGTAVVVELPPAAAEAAS